MLIDKNLNNAYRSWKPLLIRNPPEPECSCSNCEYQESEKESPMWQKALFLGFIVGICLIGGCHTVVHAEPLIINPVSSDKAILAIIGEGEGESQTCRIAIAETIRKRGSLKGVYGIHAKRILNHKYSDKSALLAKAAWFDSRFTNYSKGADGWGMRSDIAKWQKEAWWIAHKCKITHCIDKTYFWKKVSNG